MAFRLKLEALVEVIAALPDKATADYFLEGLWKYLLYTEVACAAVAEAEAKPAGIATGSKLEALASLLEEHNVSVDEGFAVRLEQVVAEVAESVAGSAQLNSGPARSAQSETARRLASRFSKSDW